ncbi:Mitochondrial 2-oxoglutarate/malate carrier protein [Blattella germanica]|nr:Mitochondrial 2-oxoglutarate/malate carrier protein [Blattella germanica]
MQLRGEGIASREKATFIHMARDVIYAEGPLALFDGLSAAVSRQIFYTSIRTGIFTSLIDMYTIDGQPPSIMQKMGIGILGNNFYCHFVSSMLSGIVTSVASIPLDGLKTRLQNMKIVDGKPEYEGMIDVATKIIKYEGFLSLFKGLTPYYLRQGPFTVIYFVILEAITKQYRKLVLGDTSGASL